ncbi:hypothetical protein PI125_g11393 [Phytophthora idaei]|nr:hypothetical protein PI125_g11393 [Phytophthora idaei]
MAQQEGDDDDQQKARHDQVGDHDVARATYETRVIIVETGTDETMAVIEEHDADGARRPASEEPQSSITGRHNADAASSGDEGRMNDGGQCDGRRGSSGRDFESRLRGFSSDSDGRRGGRGLHERSNQRRRRENSGHRGHHDHGHHHECQPRRKSAKDLELPSPKVPVSTWIGRGTDVEWHGRIRTWHLIRRYTSS